MKVERIFDVWPEINYYNKKGEILAEIAIVRADRNPIVRIYDPDTVNILRDEARKDFDTMCEFLTGIEDEKEINIIKNFVSGVYDDEIIINHRPFDSMSFMMDIIQKRGKDFILPVMPIHKMDTKTYREYAQILVELPYVHNIEEEHPGFLMKHGIGENFYYETRDKVKQLEAIMDEDFERRIGSMCTSIYNEIVKERKRREQDRRDAHIYINAILNVQFHYEFGNLLSAYHVSMMLRDCIIAVDELIAASKLIHYPYYWMASNNGIKDWEIKNDFINQILEGNKNYNVEEIIENYNKEQEELRNKISKQ